MLSNEELARAIQNGELDKIEILWKQIRRYIAKSAKGYLSTFYDNPCGVEIDDLIQQGYFAFLAAIDSFEPDKGKSFLGWLTFYLFREFGHAAGLSFRTYKDGERRLSRSMLDMSDSLDRPLTDDPDAATLADIAAPTTADIDDAETRIYIQQLRAALDDLLSELTEEEASIIRDVYFNGVSIAQLAERNGMTEPEQRNQKNTIFRKLQRKASTSEPGKALQRFIDANTQYYYRVGVDTFNRTHTSAPEALVLKREALERKYAAGIMSGVD